MSHLPPDVDNTLTAIASPSNIGQEDDPRVNMTTILPGILQGLQTSLAQLAKSSEDQTEALQSLRKDLILRSDDEGNDDISGDNNATGGNTQR